MSQLQFQTALAMLIRLPDHNRTNIEEFLSQYQLADFEKQKLHHLAKDREVIKFGNKMRSFRLDFLLQILRLSLEHIDEKNLIDFIKWEFDPLFTSIEAKSVYRHFRHFVLQNQESLKKYLGDLPEYFFDLIQFELLEGELEFAGFKDKTLPTSGPLVHHRFETLLLDFNIQEYVEKKRNLPPEESALITPKAYKTSLLFLYDGNNDYGYQIFEIDAVGVNFLQKSMQGQVAERPSYYEDLVSCGLCRL